MPEPTPPLMLVTFYENFREVEIDVHFAGTGGIDSGEELRTYLVKENVEENKGPNPEDPEHDIFEVVETKEYTEERLARYTRIRPQVNASGGTWSLEMDKFESGETPIISSPVSYLFNAASLRAAISTEDIGLDPGTLHIFRRSLRTEFGDVVLETEPGNGTFASFTDIGPNHVEVRFFFGSGLVAPRAGAAVLVHDIDLGPIWQITPQWDEIRYTLPLEHDDACSGGTKGIPIEVPQGLARTAGARSGKVTRRRRIASQRA